MQEFRRIGRVRKHHCRGLVVRSTTISALLPSLHVVSHRSQLLCHCGLTSPHRKGVHGDTPVQGNQRNGLLLPCLQSRTEPEPGLRTDFSVTFLFSFSLIEPAGRTSVVTGANHIICASISRTCAASPKIGLGWGVMERQKRHRSAMRRWVYKLKQVYVRCLLAAV